MQSENKGVFRFLPGEKLFWIVGMPGPDTDGCTIIADDGGPEVEIRFQVYGKGRFYQQMVSRDRIMWKRDSETSRRYHEWKAGNAE